MCHQSVGLIQSVIEREGMATVSISMLAEVTAKVRPPRALVVNTPFGYPLAKAGDAGLQRRIMEGAFGLLQEGKLPVMREFEG